MVDGLGSNGSRSRETRDVLLDRIIAILARVQTRGPFALLLTQAYEQVLVVGLLRLLRLLLADPRAVVRIIFDE